MISIQKLLKVTHRITLVEPFRGTSQNHADSVQRDERGDDEKDRRTPGCSTRATTTTTTTTDSARIRFRMHDVFTREEH